MSEKILSLRPNRPSLMRYLDSYIRRAHADGKQVALLVVQVKRGDELGALFGYQTVEGLLEQFGARLDDICRSQDRIMRVGDYEFALILPEIMNEGHAILAANKIMRTLATPFEIGGHVVSMGANMGIALFPDHAGKPETLLQNAELALSFSRNAS